VGEGFAGRARELVSADRGLVAADVESAAERLAGAGWDVRGQIGAVDRGAEAAEERDSEGAAELGTRLRGGRSGAGPLGRRRGYGDVGDEGW
jgi:hypothetical protein